MNLIQTYISEKLVYALGWTVLHSLWQAMVIALILGIVLVATQRHSARLRYRLSNLGLLMVMGWSIYTFFEKYWSVTDSTNNVLFQEAGVAEASSTATALQLFGGFYQYFEQHLPLIVTLWLIGVGLFTIRVLGGLAYVRHLKYHRTAVLSDYWKQKLAELTQKLDLKRPVQLLESALIKTPVVIGWIKPVVLLPIGAVNHLRPEEVEAILAHELAHIYRNDYLLNILQSIVEVIFYFNPAVWWISANVRTERENCCDDIAVELCGNSITYAKALVSLQEMSLVSPAMAMSLARNKNQLLNRVKRVLKQPQNKSNIMEKFTATCLLLMAVLVLSISANRPALAEETPPESNITEVNVSIEDLPDEMATEARETTTVYDVELTALVDDDNELPRVQRIKVLRDTLPKGIKRIEMTRDGEQIDVKLKNGRIEYLKIDGKEIPPSEYAEYEAKVEETLRNVPPPPPVPAAPPAPPAPNASSVPAPPPVPGAPPAPPAPPAAPKWHQEVGEDGQVNIVIESKEGEKPVVMRFRSNVEPMIISTDKLDSLGFKVLVETDPHIQQFISKDGNSFAFSKDGEVFDLKFPENFKGQFPSEAHIQGQSDLKQFQFHVPHLDSDATWFDSDGVFQLQDNTIMSKLREEMVKEGLLKEGEKYSIQLTDEFLKLKGKKVSQEVFERYHDLFEKLRKEHRVRFYREE